MIVESSGTQTAVIGTEHTLASPATAATRVLLVDAAAMTAGDILELRVKGAVLAAGAVSLILLQQFYDVVTDPHTQSPSVVLPQGGTLTLKQTAGTGRAFPWAVITL